MKTDIDYMGYIHGVNNSLSYNGLRILNVVEVAAIIGHLIKVVKAYPEDDIGGLNLMETLALEVCKRAAEIHPDMPYPTSEKIEQAIDKMLMVEK